MTETEIWTKWESQVVNGIFPLRRFLGRSNHSVVFLTECRAQSLAQAAIKIIPADPARSESQLSRWQLAASLSHPHLIRVLETGRCKLGDIRFFSSSPTMPSKTSRKFFRIELSRLRKCGKCSFPPSMP